MTNLPVDDESPDRALAFINTVAESVRSAEMMDVLEAVYENAGDGEWGATLHDTNMLVYSLRHNPQLATVVMSNGSMERILRAVSRQTASEHERWLWELIG